MSSPVCHGFFHRYFVCGGSVDCGLVTSHKRELTLTSWSRAFSRSRKVDYQLYIIEIDWRCFHWLAFNKLCYTYSVSYHHIHQNWRTFKTSLHNNSQQSLYMKSDDFAKRIFCVYTWLHQNKIIQNVCPSYNAINNCNEYEKWQYCIWFDRGRGLKYLRLIWPWRKFILSSTSHTRPFWYRNFIPWWFLLICSTKIPVFINPVAYSLNCVTKLHSVASQSGHSWHTGYQNHSGSVQ